ncbi:MAG: hypothetical protein EB127_22380 [Alphaproteobacteria bacterium]|nr:hypothetical protein [Alphaproteobacteria bacterium]
MNILEYGYYDIASNETETKENIIKALSFCPNTISVLPFYTRLAKNLIDHKALTSTIVDYPFGLSDTDIRLKIVDTAIKNGTDVIEIVAPAHLLCNRKYDKFRKEIESCQILANAGSVDIRYMLEYKIFTPELLYKASSILTEFNINTMYPSANYLMDNIADNILAAMMISQKNNKINIIVNGSAWTDEQINIIFELNSRPKF